MVNRSIQPSQKLVQEVRIGFIRQGSTLTAWAREHDIRIGDARSALIGVWNGPKGQALRHRIVRAARIEMAA